MISVDSCENPWASLVFTGEMSVFSRKKAGRPGRPGTPWPRPWDRQCLVTFSTADEAETLGDFNGSTAEGRWMLRYFIVRICKVLFYCLCMFMYVYVIFILYICVCVYGERLHYVCVYILYKIYSMVEYVMARFKTLQDVFTASRGTPCGASAMAPMRGEKTSSASSQAGSGLDLRMIWLIFPINNLWNQAKNWEIARNLLESIGIYGADVLDIFFEGCQQIEVDLASKHCHLTMETGENNGDIANNFQVRWLG